MNKTIISALVVLILLISIPLGIYLIQKNQTLKSRAATSGAPATIDFYGTQLHMLKLFGQNKITENSRNIVNGKGIYHAAGVVVDKSSRPNKVYVVDSGNSRVLGYNGAGVCSNNASQSCTADSDCGSGNSCKIDGTKDPDIVLGHDNLTDGACNGDNNLGFTKNPSAKTLCLVGYPYTSNIAESWARHNPAVDGQGNFYIVDGFNNRVLKFNQPLSADKTGGKGDNVADFVIGQDDFAQNGRNKGTIGVYGTISPPDNQSLYTMSSSLGWTCCGGVSVDNADNVWVTDAGNARVLRFPQGSKTADLVIGQPDFTQNGADCSRALNKFCLPVLAKVDPDTGDLYVLEMYDTSIFEVRILVFHPPFTNGMSAARTLIANQGPTFFWRGLPAFHFQATGFEFNPLKAGPYSAGKLWVNEHETFRTVLLKDNGDVVTAIGAPNATHIGGDSAFPGCNNIYLNFRLWGPGGAIGFDADNNIYLADERFHRLARYGLPYTLTTSETGRVCPPDPSGGLFPGTTPNVNVLDYTEPAVSSSEDNKLGEAIGLAVFNNQLIVQDEQRLKVWNDYLNKPMGAAPDIIVSSPPGTPTLPNRNLLSGAIDDHNRLWLLNENSKIRIYQLPFAGGDRPIADNLLLYWSDDPGAVVGGTGIRGWDNNSAGALTFDPINKKMYVMDYVHNRVLRIADHNNFGTKLLVDMVLGQPDKDHRLCNNNEIDDGDTTAHYPRANTMCLPSLGKFDNLGNLYVIENSYECHGNHRIIEFDAANLSSARGLFPNLSANRVFVADDFTHRGPCTGGVPNGPGSPVSITFNSSNQMIVGNDGYFDADPGHREYRQLWFYNNPLIKQTADGYIPLPIGATGEIVFDFYNNLIIQDHTWSKVWAINPSLDPALVVSLTGASFVFPSPVALPTAVPTSISTPTFTPTPTLTLTPTPTTTLTPTLSPTSTPTLTPTPTFTPTATGILSPIASLSAALSTTLAVTSISIGDVNLNLAGVLFSNLTLNPSSSNIADETLTVSYTTLPTVNYVIRFVYLPPGPTLAPTIIPASGFIKSQDGKFLLNNHEFLIKGVNFAPQSYNWNDLWFGADWDEAKID